jgi:hypothetical protein
LPFIGMGRGKTEEVASSLRDFLEHLST